MSVTFPNCIKTDLTQLFFLSRMLTNDLAFQYPAIKCKKKKSV